MDNDQFQILLIQKLDHQSDLMANLQRDFSAHKAATDVRVTQLEEDAASASRWAKVHAIVVLPVIAILHQVAAHFGWIR